MLPDIRRYVSALVLFVATFAVSKAQLANPFEGPVVFSYLTMDDGLVSNDVRSLLQDENGFIWMGTGRGLSRFDGHRIVHLEKTRSMMVTNMVASNDTLWVGTSNGLFCYCISQDEAWAFPLKVQGRKFERLYVTDLKFDQQGRLWITTFGYGVLCADVKSGSCRKVPTPDDGVSYGGVYVSRDGSVWAMSNWVRATLLRYNDRTRKFDEFVLRFDQQSLARWPGGKPKRLTGFAMTQDTDGWMWLAEWEGSLLRFDAQTAQAELVISSDQTDMQHTHSIAEVSRGYIMLGCDRGLVVVDTKRRQVMRHFRSGSSLSSLSDNFIYPMLVDREGGTWVGTYYGGINYTHPVSANFTSYVHDEHVNSVSGNVVNHFCEDPYHRIWIASDDGGLCYFNPGSEHFTELPLSPSGEEQNVHALSTDGTNLYVGTYTQGFNVVNLSTMKVENIDFLIDDKGKKWDASSYSVYCDSHHRVWVGTFDIVAQFHPGTHRISDVKHVGSLVISIREDHNGRLWVGTTTNGLFVREPNGKWKRYLEKSAVHRGTALSISYIFEDSFKCLWVSTNEGLFYYDTKTDSFVEARLTPNEDLLVYSITEVAGNLWLATTEGVLCYSLADKEVIQAYKGGGNIVSIDFLPSAVLRSSDGSLYFGTTKGFFTFDPQTMYHCTAKPRVIFTGLDVLNRPVTPGSDILPKGLPYMDEIHLSYKDNVFRIYFSAMSYLQPSDVFYRYQLVGFDDDWVDAGDRHSVTYTNLSPGTYTLRVRAKMNDGVEAEDAVLRIVITPPFYWNTPAKFFYAFLFAAAIFFVMRHLLHRKDRKHVAEIKELNTQKEHEIQELNVQKEQEIQELNVQKEQEIQELNIQKEQEIQELNIQKEQEVHDARIKFMTITDKDQEFLDRLENVIEQNFSNSDLSVDDLATELGVSRSGMFAKIKALADVTPNEMIQVIRLKHAATLLLSGNYRVNEVCYMAGFSSPSYFSKCFQKQYGTTPAKYKG